MALLTRLLIDEATRPPSGQPSVGIFFGIMLGRKPAILYDGTPVESAEEYGNCMTHPRDHFSMWEASRIHLGLRDQYDDSPRGRIVFQTRNARFVVYLDRQLDVPAFRNAVLHIFSLPQPSTYFRYDQHYAHARNKIISN
jgi:hypothetical protein